MGIPTLFQLDFQGDDAKLKVVADETIAAIHKLVPKGILKVLEVTRREISGKTLIELGVELHDRKFGEVRAVFGKTWRSIANKHGALPEGALEKMRQIGEL